MEPASLSAQLITSVEEWRAAGVRDDLQLQRIKHQAESLKQTPHRAYAYMVLGMVACLNDSPEQMRQYHEKSLVFEPSTKVFVDNFCTSLLASGFVAEGLERHRSYFDECDRDPECAQEYVGALFTAGRLHEVVATMNELGKSRFEETGIDSREIEGWLSSLKGCELNDDDVQEAIESVFSVMHQGGYFFHSHDLEFCEDEFSAWLSLVVRPAGVRSVSSAMELNDRLIDKLVNSSINAFDTGAFVARFSRVRELDVG